MQRFFHKTFTYNVNNNNLFNAYIMIIKII